MTTGAQRRSPTVRLAATYGMMAAPDEAIPVKYPFASSLDDPMPGVSLLVSYIHLERWSYRRRQYVFDDWVMDSGAFSARASGVKISLQSFTEACLHLQATDPTLTEVFALDVIGDHKRTLQNVEVMWSAGVECIPTYHIGEPVDYLVHIAKEYPKIALGGMADLRGNRKIEWARWCFQHVWPKRIHGFAAGARDIILALPWHSVDTTSWEVAPTAMGRWKAFGSKHLSVRGRYSIRAEVEFYKKLEREAQLRWAKVLENVA